MPRSLALTFFMKFLFTIATDNKLLVFLAVFFASFACITALITGVFNFRILVVFKILIGQICTPKMNPSLTVIATNTLFTYPGILFARISAFCAGMFGRHLEAQVLDFVVSIERRLITRTTKML